MLGKLPRKRPSLSRMLDSEGLNFDLILNPSITSYHSLVMMVGKKCLRCQGNFTLR